MIESEAVIVGIVYADDSLESEPFPESVRLLVTFSPFIDGKKKNHF